MSDVQQVADTLTNLNITELIQLKNFSAAIANLSNEFYAREKLLDDVRESLDEFFAVLIGALVMFMQAGFAFLQCGGIRMKNVTKIFLTNCINLFVAAIAYWFSGKNLMQYYTVHYILACEVVYRNIYAIL